MSVSVRTRYVVMCNEGVHLVSEMKTGVHFERHEVVTLPGSSPGYPDKIW